VAVQLTPFFALLPAIDMRRGKMKSFMRDFILNKSEREHFKSFQTLIFKISTPACSMKPQFLFTNISLALALPIVFLAIEKQRRENSTHTHSGAKSLLF
jgi:hypothetical protein